MKTRKKLIEVALPLEAINIASIRENYIYRGNPSALHKWWAQRPLAAARAVIFAQIVDDPSAHPELFRTAEAQEVERQRLFRIIEQLVQWENINNESVLQKARNEIWRSWRATCAENADHPNAATLFNPDKLPGFHDPFAGGGTLPLEAQRLGFKSYASDLNPVAVLINKAMIELSPMFAGQPPINPEARKEQTLWDREWKGAEGLAEDVRYYGKWMRDEAEKRIGHLYPKVEVTTDIAKERPDLRKYVGQKLNVIAWLWARTVKSPNPAFAHVDVPLATSFILSTKPGKEHFVEPIIDGDHYRFTVRAGKPKDAAVTQRGTKSGSSGSSFLCLISGTPMTFEYLRSEAKAGRMGAKLMAIVAEGDHARLYLPPTAEMESIALGVHPKDVPDAELPEKALGFRVQEYGMRQWSDLFTGRQLFAMMTFADLVGELRNRVHQDALSLPLAQGLPTRDQTGTSSISYADAVGLYSAFAVDKYATYGNSLVPWYSKEDRPSMLFSQQVVPMVWDYTEINPFSTIGGSLTKSQEIVAGALDGLPMNAISATVEQRDAAANLSSSTPMIVSTDPPYYANVPYADLSDFFYVWLRYSLKSIFPKLFETLSVPKADELVASPYRHGGMENAEAFFLEGMTRAMHRLVEVTHPAFPVTIYYAFKQSESKKNEGTANTGWETFLEAVIRAGFSISGTWPMRTERTGRVRDTGSNALASSIVLVCRPRLVSAPISSRREFVSTLRAELPLSLTDLQHGNIAPVDLAQAAIGPGMAIYTRFASVLDADGRPVSVRDALSLINQTLDEVLTEQEGDFDPDSRWALTWFEQSGFTDGEYGVAETLSKAKNTSVAGLAEAGILTSSRGKVRLLKPSDLPKDWDPTTDTRMSAWEIVHHLIRVFEADGERAAAALVAQLGSKAEAARELCYRLYTLCERKKRTAEALSYNALVQSWPEITRLAREDGSSQARQAALL